MNVVGALSELAKDQTNRLALRKGNGIGPLISLLTGTNPALLVNVTRAVGHCAREPDNMAYVSISVGLLSTHKRIQPVWLGLGCIHIDTSTSPGTRVQFIINTSLHVFQ